MKMRHPPKNNLLQTATAASLTLLPPLIYSQSLPTSSPTSTNLFNPTTTTTSDAPASTISGHSFQDANNNGIKDSGLDYAISSVNIALYDCLNDASALQETTTDFAGKYSFAVSSGNYRIVVTPPSYYAFSTAWTGDPEYPDATSIIDPDTGRSNCFTVIDVANVNDKDVGLVISYTPVVSSPTTASPTGVIVTSPPITGVVTSPPVVVTSPPVVASTLAPVSSPPTVSPVVLTNAPSKVPSTSPSEIPSGIPTSIPSSTPFSIFNTTTSPTTFFSNTTTPPSLSPSPTTYFEQIGPTTTRGLQISFEGISSLDNATQWSLDTASYIENYFSEGYGVWDLSVEITVVDEGRRLGADNNDKSNNINNSNGNSNNKNDIGGRRLGADDHNNNNNNKARRNLQAKLTVTYDQTTTYKTNENVPLDYILTKPFESQIDQARYVIYLSGQNEYYGDVTSASSVTLPGEQDGEVGQVKAPTPSPPNDNSDKSNTVLIIIGVCVGLGVLLLIVGLYLMYRRTRRDRGENYIVEPRQQGSNGVYNVGVDYGGNVASNSRGLGRDLEGGSRGGANDDDVSAMTGQSYPQPQGTTLDIIAPAGKLGVVIDIPPDRIGAPFVCELHDTSPLYGQIMPGDRIYAVDDVDVRQMSAIKVSKLLAQKSENPERCIRIFREYVD